MRLTNRPVAKLVCALLVVAVGLYAYGGNDQSIPSPKRPLRDLPPRYGSAIWLADHQEWDGVPKPKEWDQLAARLDAEVKGRQWTAAISTTEQLRRLLPSLPPLDYPWNGLDTLGDWDNAIAALHMFNLDFVAAERQYGAVLSRIPASSPGKSGARQQARYGLAVVKAALGKYRDAMDEDHQAPSEYWSGCGNCMAGEASYEESRRLVWKAADQSFDDAYRSLLGIVNGRVPMRMFSLPDLQSLESRRKVTQPLAALTLGQMCLARGKKEDAIKLFQFAASFDEGEPSEIALCYCYSLGVLKS